MKLKSKNNSFLIRFPNKETLNKGLWLAALQVAISAVPGFKVEGLTSKKRISNPEKKVAQLEIRDGNDYVEFGEYIRKDRSVIGVGVSSKYNVSFEDPKDFLVSKYLPIYSVPILDIEKDFSLILDKFEAYIYEVAPVNEPKAHTEVTYHSNFIRVGNSRVDYDDEAAIKRLLKGKKKKAKEVPYSLSRVIIA